MLTVILEGEGVGVRYVRSITTGGDNDGVDGVDGIAVRSTTSGKGSDGTGGVIVHSGRRPKVW